MLDMSPWVINPSLELDQIAEEFKSLCGVKSSHMTLDPFTSLMTRLGYPAERCESCFRYVLPPWVPLDMTQL